MASFRTQPTAEELMKWEEVLKRTDLVGGELEAQEGGDVYRGPIKSIELKGGVVGVTLEWCARMPGLGKPGCGEWKVHQFLGACVSAEILPHEISDKRLMVSVPGLGVWVIFPKGGSQLDPAKVLGLRIMQELKK